MPATAADIPPELFERILVSLRPPDSYFEKAEHEVDADKHDLARCALVCKYWARMCQEKLFISVALRSFEDVDQLRAFLHSPRSRIGSYIHQFQIQIKTPQMYTAVPWIHLVPSLYGRLRYRRNVAITLQGPLPPKQKVLRTIHWLLPKTMPSFSSEIRELNLRDVHFRSFSDLVHLASELRNMMTMACIGVTWPDGASVPLKLPRSNSRKLMLRHIQMARCTTNLCAFWLVIGLRWPEDPRFSQNDFEHLMECAQVLWNSGQRQGLQYTAHVKIEGIYDRVTGEIRSRYCAFFCTKYVSIYQCRLTHFYRFNVLRILR